MRNAATALKKNVPAEQAVPRMEAERKPPSGELDVSFPILAASDSWGTGGAVGEPVRRMLVPTIFQRAPSVRSNTPSLRLGDPMPLSHSCTSSTSIPPKPHVITAPPTI